MKGIREKTSSGERILIDGATGTELEKRNAVMDGMVWSAEATLAFPDVLKSIHTDYINAGAEVITANTFSSAKHMLKRAGKLDIFKRLNEEAMRIALAASKETFEETGKHSFVAGSVAPTTFCVQSKMCYPTDAEARVGYKEQAEILAESGADLLIVEMIEDIEQGSRAVEACLSTGLPVWLGFSCVKGEDGNIYMFEGEETLEETAKVICPMGGDAALIMHTLVEDAKESLILLSRFWSKTLGVYAHAGHFEMPSWIFEDISSEKYADFVQTYIDSGASIIGGCCGIGVEQISFLHKRFIDKGRRQLTPQF